MNILFFHGNGEIVDDYDDLGPFYNRLGINFLAVDYRGYGNSTGKPTTSAMLADCHVIFKFVNDWLREKGYTGALIVMGRSLGSASAAGADQPLSRADRRAYHRKRVCLHWPAVALDRGRHRGIGIQGKPGHPESGKDQNL
ncbi:MAG: lysophospholipase [Desulfobacterales bacterium]|nr:lysophospholipase [Desulfobacterales bacterium]